MLSPLQIERLLKYCEKVNEGYENYHGPSIGMSGDEGPEYFEYIRNKGWVEALRLVMECNGPAMINNKLKEDNAKEKKAKLDEKRASES